MDRFFDSDVLLFTIPALVGGGVFLLKLAMMLFGGIGEGADMSGDFDVDAAVDLEVGSDAADGTTDSDVAFSVLSVQSLAAFAMGFGTGGIGARFGLGWENPASAAVGVAFGALLLWLLGMMMKAMFDLQSSGNISLHETVGLTATVYTNIPETRSGAGSVRVVVNQRLRTFRAFTEGQAIGTGKAVRITKANDDNTVTVVTADA